MSRAKASFFIAVTIVLARIIYLAMETSYNMAIIDMMATPLLTAAQAKVVEQLGHKLAALGLALLLTPPVVRFALKGTHSLRSQVIAGIATATIVFLAVFSTAFHAQTYLMDKLVQASSPEARYDAYYSVLFRQLYVEGGIDDPEFSLSRNAGAIMIAMPFAWSHQADLGEQLRNTGSELVLERAQKQAVLEHFESDYEAYRHYQELTGNFLQAYRKASKEAMAKVNPEEYSPANLYGEVVESLYRRYPSYQALNDQYLNHVRFLQSQNWYYSEVRSLFQGSKNEQAWQHRVLLKKAGVIGTGIEIESWCAQGCPGSLSHIRNTLRAALNDQYSSRAFGVPMGLSLKGFLSSHDAINATLESVTDRPGHTFVQSPVTFAIFKRAMDKIPFGPDVSTQVANTFPEVIGLYVPAGMSDQELVDGDLFPSLLAETVGERFVSFDVDLTKGEFFNAWLKKSEQVVRASEDIILPETPSQMMEEQNIEAGLAAVRMMYIPTVAAVVSALMCTISLLSIIWVVAAFLGKPKLPVALVFGASVMLLASTGLYSSMPTKALDSVWVDYTERSIVAGHLWEVFFGLERAILFVTSGGEMVIPAAVSNQLLEKGLGWAL